MKHKHALPVIHAIEYGPNDTTHYTLHTLCVSRKQLVNKLNLSIRSNLSTFVYLSLKLIQPKGMENS